MAQNFIQPGKHMPYTLTAPVDSGDIVVVGDLVGVALHTGITGQQIEVALEGVWQLPKVAADNIAQGAPVYVAAGEITSDDDGGANKKAGYAFAAAGAGVASILVKLAQ